MNYAIFTHLFFRPNFFHFEEWLKYHIDFGVDHFYLYESSHSGIPCLNKDTKRQIDIPLVSDIPYSRIYKYYDEIRERYKDYCTFIKWLPKDKNGNYLEHHQIHAHEQATAFKHFYQNHASKYDRVSTIDCDEFYYNDKHSNIKDFINTHKENILLLGCKFFESTFINIGGLVTQKTKCLNKFSRVGAKYIFNPKKIDYRYKFSPHYPPYPRNQAIDIDYNDFCFYHYKINENSKIAIENHGKQKMQYTEDKSMAERASYLKDYSFIEKPQIQESSIDSQQDILGLDSFQWDEIQH